MEGRFLRKTTYFGQLPKKTVIRTSKGYYECRDTKDLELAKKQVREDIMTASFYEVGNNDVFVFCSSKHEDHDPSGVTLGQWLERNDVFLR